MANNIGTGVVAPNKKLKELSGVQGIGGGLISQKPVAGVTTPINSQGVASSAPYLSAQQRIDSGENPLSAIAGGFAGSVGNFIQRTNPPPGLASPMSRQPSLKDAWNAIPSPSATDFATAEQDRYAPRTAFWNATPQQPAGSIRPQVLPSAVNASGIASAVPPAAPTATSGNPNPFLDGFGVTATTTKIAPTKGVGRETAPMNGHTRYPLEEAPVAPETAGTIADMGAPDTALWPTTPINLSGTMVSDSNNLKTLAGGLTSQQIRDTSVPSGGGIATMGDQTVMLRGGNSVPQAENDAVIAAREAPTAPQPTIVGGANGVAAALPGQDISNLFGNSDDLTNMIRQNRQRKTDLNNATIAHLNSEVTSRGIKSGLDVTAAPFENNLKRSQADAHDIAGGLALQEFPGKMAYLQSQTDENRSKIEDLNATREDRIKGLRALTAVHRAGADAAKFTNSPEGIAAVQAGVTQKQKADALKELNTIGSATYSKHFTDIMKQQEGEQDPLKRLTPQAVSQLAGQLAGDELKRNWGAAIDILAPQPVTAATNQAAQRQILDKIKALNPKDPDIERKSAGLYSLLAKYQKQP